MHHVQSSLDAGTMVRLMPAAGPSMICYRAMKCILSQLPVTFTAIGIIAQLQGTEDCKATAYLMCVFMLVQSDAFAMASLIRLSCHVELPETTWEHAACVIHLN